MIRLTLAWTVVTLWGCSTCEREACEAANRPASASISQGIAGLTAVESDAIVNGCQMCIVGETRLDIWRTPTLVGDVDTAKSIRASGMAAVTVRAAAHYQQPLEDGTWLVCTTDSGFSACAAVAIGPRRMITVNVHHPHGPPTLVVFEGGSRRQTGVFQLQP
jgi:hypothetical protein